MFSIWRNLTMALSC